MSEAPALTELARLPIFRGLPPADLAIVRGVLTQRAFTQGQALFTEGERAREMFVLLQGDVSVHKRLPDGREERLATLVPGAILGEMALIDGQSRSASARAASPRAVVLALSREDFDRLFHANKPFAFQLLDRIVVELSGRLRRAAARLAETAAHDAPAARAAKAREAAASLLGMDLTQLDLGDIDLDAIEFEIAPPETRRRAVPRQGS